MTIAWLRSAVLLALTAALLLVWVCPILWGLATSLKTERDVLAYPPALVFRPTDAAAWNSES